MKTKTFIQYALILAVLLALAQFGIITEFSAVALTLRAPWRRR